MSFVQPYLYESEPEPVHSYDLAFIALGVIGVLQFEWDEGNRKKNEIKHDLTVEEIEAALNDRYGFIAMVRQNDEDYFPGYGSYGYTGEKRFILFSHREKEKYMMVVFTLRILNGQLAVRPIHARYVQEKEMHKKLARNGYNDAKDRQQKL